MLSKEGRKEGAPCLTSQQEGGLSIQRRRTEGKREGS